MHPQQEKWNQRYRENGGHAPLQAAQVLRDYRHLLPARGKALDLACGLGANAILLAQQGLKISAWDISDVALQRLQHSAAIQQLSIDTELRDVVASPPQASQFDVIVVSHFLDRGLFPSLKAALNPQGLLFYQTFILDKCTEDGPGNPEYLLAQNELLRLCAGMRVLAYREEGRVGDCTRGFRNEALIVVQRL
jgi:tellurite methyltransferase